MKVRSLDSRDPDLARFCALEGPDALSPQDVHLHAPDLSLIVEDGAVPAARCSLWWRATPTLPGGRVGLLGHYAERDAAAAASLLAAACERLRAEGCELAVGPMDGNTWRRYRLLSWRGTDPPFFLEPDNPDDWPRHFEAAGFTPLATYYSSKCDDLAGYPADAALAADMHAAGLRSRPIDTARLERELGTLWRLATDAFTGGFLYTPVDEAEFRRMYAPRAAFARPELVRLIERQGQPIGFLFALPDMLQAARGEPVDTVIFKTLAVARGHRRHGLANWIVDSMMVQARELGFRHAVFALMHESNPSRRLGRGRMREIRRYTLYARPL